MQFPGLMFVGFILIATLFDSTAARQPHTGTK